MYAKKSNIIICFIICFILLLFGCSSAPRVDESIIEHNRQITILETRNQLYESAIRDCIGEITAIRERAGNSEATIDQIIREFDCYKRAIERLLQYYNYSEAEVENEINY